MTLRRITQGCEYIFLFLLMSGPPAMRERDPMATLRGELDPVAILKAVTWIAAAAWIVWRLARPLSSRRLDLALPEPPLAVILALGMAVLMGASAINSPSPEFTLFRAYQVAVGVVVGWLLVLHYGARWSVDFLKVGLATLCYAVFLAYLVAPKLVVGDSERYFGIRGDLIAPAGPVALGLFTIALVWPSVEAGRYRESRLASALTPPRPPLPEWLARWLFGKRWLLLLLSASLIILSRRRVAMVLAVLVFALAGLMASRTWPLTGKLGLLVAAVGASIFAWLRWSDAVLWFVRNPEQLQNLSGRSQLWSGLLTGEFDQNLGLGLGYVAGTRPASLAINPNLGNAHSSFVEVLVGAGIVAGCLYLLIWGILAVRCVLAGVRGTRLGMLQLYLCLLLGGYAVMTSHAILPGPVSFMFWILLASTCVAQSSPARRYAS